MNEMTNNDVIEIIHNWCKNQESDYYQTLTDEILVQPNEFVQIDYFLHQKIAESRTITEKTYPTQKLKDNEELANISLEALDPWAYDFTNIFDPKISSAVYRIPDTTRYYKCSNCSGEGNSNQDDPVCPICQDKGYLMTYALVESKHDTYTLAYHNFSDTAKAIVPEIFRNYILDQVIEDDVLLLDDNKAIDPNLLVDTMENNFNRDIGKEYQKFKSKLIKHNNIMYTKQESLSHATSFYGISTFLFEDKTYNILINMTNGHYVIDEAFINKCHNNSIEFDEKLKLTALKNARNLRIAVGVSAATLIGYTLIKGL